ncbi:branched-chain amino acid ABC transporter permease [Thermus scotoductus]|uniref:branched-chain amino acid ABC transporter permease n=1 Tax=Thermus scotoductus TaxID=37636 RepID=UPI000F8072E3|nr:branched-chain amino acid ABC transporter permease [Thermus scotoductus]RTH31845.1 branched-chain amino acid ABC transporter permease [Thermus scotoductus]RTI13019.1 branched-chain amino acid ABC transporter permease [Thermus scotoductus]
MYPLSKQLTDAFSRRFARAVRETYREDEAYASTPLGRLALGVFLLFLVLLPFLLSPYPMYVATLVAIGALSALGLHLLVGGAGQISLGHAAFMGVGAYTASHLYGPLAFLGILLGGGIAALLGLVLGLPSLRIKGVYLAIATLAFQFLADYVFKNWEGVTGGIRGRTLPPAELFGLALDTPEKLWYLVLFFTLPLFFYGKRLLMTRAGRAFMAVRDNDLSARVAGVDLVQVKLMAFALSAFYAGVAGGLLAQLYKAVTPEYFPLTVSIQYLAMVIVGGAGTVLGAVLGAFFVLLIPEVLNSLVGALGPQYAATLAAWRNVAFGLLILAFLILEPLGLVGLWGRIRNYFRTWPLPY